MENLTFRGKWAQQLVRQKIYEDLQRVQQRQGAKATPTMGIPLVGGDWRPDNLPPDEKLDQDRDSMESFPDGARVCIVGAGAAGLYIAMMLDWLNIPELSYDILESSGRIGGRMLTHYFSPKAHDYYDIGAMRFPEISNMTPTFRLFKELKIPLLPYYLDTGSVKCPSRYNDITFVDGGEKPPDGDTFRVSVTNGGRVPDATIRKGLEAILREGYKKYKDMLGTNWKEGFDALMAVDNYTTRQYFQTQNDPKYGFFSIQWLENNSSASGLFDQAFTESVIDSFDFDGKDTKWYCINGGTSVLTNAMASSIKGRVQYHKRVCKIANDRSLGEASMLVRCADESKDRAYITVFNTTTLGCLQRMDLEGLDLHPCQKDAIRCLHYDDSAKVAMKFTYPWWITECGITQGGVASTDMPLRTCVYPSYNLKDPENQSSILLCSYTWAQDATRIGSLVLGDPESERQLLEVMFDDLAKLHSKNFVGKTYEEIREIISGAYITHHAWSWSHDPHTSGAFALFGPGQFANLYPYLSRPTAESKFHFVGEAASTNHAWIAGALDSAYAAVFRFLRKYEMWGAMQRLQDKWNPEGKIGDVEHGKNGTVHLQVLLGMQQQKDMV